MASRLQKIIAASGLMSRRAAEEAIAAGRVTVNGLVASLGDLAEDSDIVCVDQKPIPSEGVKHTFLLNKPRGYVSTLQDEKGRPSVRELLPADIGRVYPVGRLDMMSEGLLLLTNDGDFALRCTHPSHGIQKTYRTSVSGGNLCDSLSRLREPFTLDGVSVQAKQVQVLKQTRTHAVVDITVGEGRNREIRRMCEAAGLHVDRLVRISVGGLSLGDLPSGHFRELTQDVLASVVGDVSS